MNNKSCYIVGAGDFFGIEPEPGYGDLVIAADAGYRHLMDAGIPADIVIGDFDSAAQPPSHPNVIKLSIEKDETDMLAAINIGLERGYTVFHIYGGTGGRLDHTLANIQSLASLSKKGAQGIMYGEDYTVTAITDGEINFDETHSGTISVFCHSETAIGVSLKGLKYPLTDAVLSNTFPLGVSNEFTGAKSSIEVTKGTLIVVCSRQKEVP